MQSTHEEILFTGSNPTFHRSGKQEVEFVITNKSFSYRHGNRSFKRIELKDILAVELLPLPKRSFFFKTFGVLLGITPIMLALIVWILGTSISLRAWLTILFVSTLLAYAFYVDVRSNLMRHVLVIQSVRRTIRIKSPSDPYLDEQIYDLQLFRNVLTACNIAGVKTCDQSAAEQVTAADSTRGSSGAPLAKS